MQKSERGNEKEHAKKVNNHAQSSTVLRTDVTSFVSPADCAFFTTALLDLAAKYAAFAICISLEELLGFFFSCL